MPHTHTIILLHGRGSTGKEFAEDLFECKVDDNLSLKERFPSCRWMFPSAKPRYSTVFQEEMTEWFDIYSLTDPEEQATLQKPGLIDALQLLTALIQDELKTIDASKLIIGGISQGFATAATFMIALDFKCAGFIGLSGLIPFASQIEKASTGVQGKGTTEASQRATMAMQELLDKGTWTSIWPGHWIQTPMFLAHEQHDNVVVLELGETAYKLFQTCGADATWHTYDSGDHWIQEPDEINHLAQFLDYCIRES